MNTIILAAGQLNHRLLPMGAHQSNATIPVNGKPVIAWILDDLIAKGVSALIIVVRADNQRLSELLRLCYDHKLQITILEIEQSESIVHSLKTGLEQADNSMPSRVILGDTLIRDDFQHVSGDFIYTARVNVSDIWCVAEVDTNGAVKAYRDKQSIPGDSFDAVAGYYQFSDSNLLQQSVFNIWEAGKTQLSDVLTEYAATKPIRPEPLSEWFDFGHIGSFIHSKKSLLRPRHFNRLAINPLLNTISKESTLDEKLRQELSWYDQVPAELQVLTPRIVRREERNGKLYFEQEYYGYPALSELYLYADLDLDAWRHILHYLLDIHQLFCTYTAHASKKDCLDMYLNKTLERIDALTSQDESWSALFQEPHITWNGQKLANWPLLKTRVTELCENLTDCPGFAIIHGDLCFSNILYDPASQIARLIDPRGSFGRPGIFGDPRYDLAKLRHSIAGAYDYIISDLFRLEQNGHTFETRVLQNPVQTGLSAFFDRELASLGYKVEDIQLIEGLLFFSMLPLHRDHPGRQKMMFLRGLQLFNEQCFLSDNQAT